MFNSFLDELEAGDRVHGGEQRHRVGAPGRLDVSAGVHRYRSRTYHPIDEGGAARQRAGRSHLIDRARQPCYRLRHRFRRVGRCFRRRYRIPAQLFSHESCIRTDDSGRYACLYKHWRESDSRSACRRESLRGEATGAAIGFNADAAATAKRRRRDAGWRRRLHRVGKAAAGGRVAGRRRAAARPRSRRTPAAPGQTGRRTALVRRGNRRNAPLPMRREMEALFARAAPRQRVALSRIAARRDRNCPRGTRGHPLDSQRLRSAGRVGRGQDRGVGHVTTRRVRDTDARTQWPCCPSPTPDATRLTEPCRTSPTAKTPGTLVVRATAATNPAGPQPGRVTAGCRRPRHESPPAAATRSPRSTDEQRLGNFAAATAR